MRAGDLVRGRFENLLAEDEEVGGLVEREGAEDLGDGKREDAGEGIGDHAEGPREGAPAQHLSLVLQQQLDALHRCRPRLGQHRRRAALANDLADVVAPVEDVVIPIIPFKDGALGPTRWSAGTCQDVSCTRITVAVGGSARP